MPGADAGPRGRSGGSAADVLINHMAADQHGIVTTAQLRAAGVSHRVIEHRAKRGLMTRMHRGVYRIGPIVSPRAAEMAALLACGDTAVLSHGTAAELLGIVRHRTTNRVLRVTVRSGRPVCRRGLRVHRSAGLGDDEVMVVDGLRVTTPVRTLVDLAGEVDLRELERMVARADRDGLLEREAVEVGLRRHTGRAGIGALRALLAPETSVAFSRSELEDRFPALIRRAELPEPSANVRVAGLEVDFLWRDGGLVVEVDGFGFHSGRSAFELDRRRAAALVAAGYRVVRFTWTEVTRKGMTVATRVAQALVWAERADHQGRA